VAEQDEQLEAFKRWWKKNWPSLALGIGLALLIVAGWQYWQNKQETDRAAARQGFETMVGALSNPDEEERRATLEYALDALKTEHRRSVYAVFSAMVAASYYMEEGEPEVAATELKWALDNAKDDPLPLVIRERLARAQITAGDEEAALATIDAIDDKGKFEALFLELKGDIYRVRGDYAEARQAYKAALDSLSEGQVDRLLELKIADLAVAEEG